MTPVGISMTDASLLPAGARANGHDAAMIAEARRLVEQTIRTQDSIAAELGLGRSTLTTWKQQHGWVRPPGAPVGRPLGTRPDATKAEMRRRRLIDKLYAVCGRYIRRVEARLGDADYEGDEKDARTLGTLTRTLEMLMALERDNGTTADKPEAVNRDELNADLARRITRWAEGGEGSE
jgi:hypothetical protein